MTERLGDAPIQKEYRDQMIAVAKTLDEFFNGSARGSDRKVGFIVLVFEYGDQEGRWSDELPLKAKGADSIHTHGILW